MSIAVVFGTFAPMHRGHLDLIHRAKRENDKAIVIVSGRKGDRGDKIGLNLTKRFRYIREAFKNDKLVEVYELDETNIPEYPNGWDVWLELLLKSANKTKDDDLVFYVSEQEYADELEKRGFKSHFTERNFGLSATQIRENPAKFWNFIARPFRRHFSKNVLIVGSASNGKTTLAIDLARFFSAPVSFEYAREFQVKFNITDTELLKRDFFDLLIGQYRQTSLHIDGNENRGLVIADTNSTVTKVYYDHYYSDGDDSDAFNKMYDSIVAAEKWDLIIFVEPTGSYIDDGFRDMSMADDQIRDKFTEDLKQLMIEKHPDVPIKFIGGNYLENYQQAINYINEIYKEY